MIVEADPAPSLWRSRGYMPHFESGEAIQHVTFHLADSLPREVVERLKNETFELPPERRDNELRIRLENWIDAGHGSCVLAEPELATLVEDVLLHFDFIRYRLFAWVVMPNHVHVLFQPRDGWTMGQIVASWKSFTGSRISVWAKERGRSVCGLQEGRVWQREYWDRYMRDQNHFLDAKAYIHRNPVKAGLVAKPEDWPWSSAALAGWGQP